MCVCVYVYMYICGCVGVCHVYVCVPRCVYTSVTYMGVCGVNVMCACVHVWVEGAVRCCVCVCVCVYVCPRGHNQCIAYESWKLSPCFHSLIPKCKHRILYAITSVLTPFDCHGRVSSALHPNPPHTRMCVCVRVLSMWVCAGDYEAVSMCMCMCIYYVWTCPSH